MKLALCCFGLLATLIFARANGLPSVTTQPTNQNVLPGNTASFSVMATGATGYQWRFNGVDIADATNATLQVPNMQTNKAGYYMVVVKNSTGWVPSQLAYLSAGAYGPNSASCGIVPFSNLGIASAQANYNVTYGSGPISDAFAQVVAGPQLDQMAPIGDVVLVTNGYFTDSPQIVPTVQPGQTVYYRVDVSYLNGANFVTQPSTVLKLISGGTVPDAGNLKFPVWIEWPGDPAPMGTTSTNQIRVPGETVRLTNDFYCNGDYGIATGQWRKDGALLPNGTNFFQVPPISAPGYGLFRAVLTISNVQPADAGVYDVQVLGNNWIIGPKTSLSVQTMNGTGVFSSPHSDGSNFVASLQGIAGRSYNIQWSSNLADWNSLQTISNSTGTISITNTGADPLRFYRARLLP